MATLNKVMLIGRVTADVGEPRALPAGGTVASFRFAVGRSRKNQQTGQWENDPNPLYIDCEAFGKPDARRNLAAIVAEYVKKGDQLYLDGRLVLDEWEDKNGGGRRSKHKVIVDNIEFLGGQGGGAAGGEEAAKPARAEPPRAAGKPAAQQKAPPKGGARKAPVAVAPDGDGFGVDDGGEIPF